MILQCNSKQAKKHLKTTFQASKKTLSCLALLNENFES